MGVATIEPVELEATRALEFDDFYAREYGPLAGALRLMCGDSGAAEEVAQEAFVRAYERWSRVREFARPRAWLYTVAFNLARRRRRRAARPLPPISASRPDDPASSADRMIMADSLARLPMSQRQAVVARYVLGLSTEEAAAVLGISAGALRAVLHRAVVVLRADPDLTEVLP